MNTAAPAHPENITTPDNTTPDYLAEPQDDICPGTSPCPTDTR